MIYIWATLLIMQSLSGLPCPHFFLNHGSQISCGHNSCLDIHLPCSKFSLQWFMQKVQDRIILSTLRSLVIKDANKLRWDCLALMLLNWDIFQYLFTFFGSMQIFTWILGQRWDYCGSYSRRNWCVHKVVAWLAHTWFSIEADMHKGIRWFEESFSEFSLQSWGEGNLVCISYKISVLILVIYGYFRGVSMWYQGFKLKLFLIVCWTYWNLIVAQS